MLIQLAWKNLWRNKKRTIIAASSIFFAVVLSVFMRSGQKGSFDYMIHMTVSSQTGYIQVHGKDFWDKRSLDQSIVIDSKEQKQFREIPNVTSVVPRLESFSLISFGSATKVASIIGTEPISEDQMTRLKSKVIAGTYLDNTSDGILVAEGLARLLKISVGDSIVLFGQGYQGMTAAALLPVAGIVKFNFPAQNEKSVYLNLPTAQWLFAAPDRITSLSFMIGNIRYLKPVTGEIRSVCGDRFEIMTWEEMMPELVQMIQSKIAAASIMLMILYLVVGFGIFATVMMFTNERLREFGMLISIGMRKIRLIWVTFIETIFISFIGATAGSIVGFIIVFYGMRHPIHLTGETAEMMLSYGFEPLLTFDITPALFTDQVVIVTIIALVSAIYPLMFIRRLKPIKALHSL